MIELLLSGLLWRLRGVIGWPGTLLFALVQAWTLWPVSSEFALFFALWIMVGEPTGWKPKYIRDRHQWATCALYGARIGLIGGLAVPLSTALHMMFGEPSFPNNPKPTQFFFKRSPSYLLDWRNAWNEVYFGLIFSGVLQCLVFLAAR